MKTFSSWREAVKVASDSSAYLIACELAAAVYCRCLWLSSLSSLSLLLSSSLSLSFTPYCAFELRGQASSVLSRIEFMNSYIFICWSIMSECAIEIIAVCFRFMIDPFIGETWLYLVTFPIVLCRKDGDRILINSLLFPSSSSFNSVPSVVTRFQFCKKVDSSLSCLLTSYDKLLEQSIALHCHLRFIAAVVVVVAVAAVHCEHHRCLQYWFGIVVSHSKSDSLFHLFA